MADPLELKYAALKDPGIRAFMIAGERFYPADAVSFTMAEQRDFYDIYCAHFRKPRPENIVIRISPWGLSCAASISRNCQKTCR